MKNFINYLILILLLGSILTIVPVWDISLSTINLLNKEAIFEYEIANKPIENGYKIILSKQFRRQQGSIKKTNFIRIYSPTGFLMLENIANYEDIESAYTANNSYYVCPKGKNHLLKYYDKNSYERIIPNDFNSNSDWELKCFYQSNLKYLFVAYTNHNNYFYQLDINSGKIIYNKNIKDELFDFKWTTGAIDDKYLMFAFYLDANNIYLGQLNFGINNKGFEIEDGNKKKIYDSTKKNYNLYFNEENDNFHFLNYDDIKDFQTGYSEQFDRIDSNNFEQVITSINNNNPLEFIDEVKIEEIKFIRNTKYIYYKLYNTNKNIYYYGIIDVVLNKVIFNTDEQFKLFIPYSNNAMLAMTSDKLYKICMIYNNNDCANKCPEGKKLVFDVNNKNICKDSITCSNYILKPNDICMDTCDLSIYTSNEKKNVVYVKI